MGAIGAVMYAHSNKLEMNHFKGMKKLEEYLADDSTPFQQPSAAEGIRSNLQ